MLTLSSEQLVENLIFTAKRYARSQMGHDDDWIAETFGMLVAAESASRNTLNS